jgi:hypothetical protein
MSETITVPWGTLERWSPVAFGVGGVSWLILMTIVAVGRFVEVSAPVWVFPLFLVIGMLAAYIALFGIYPHIKAAAPRLSLAGAGVVVIAAALVVFAVLYTVGTGTVDEGPPFPVFPLIILSTVVGFLLIGTASVRTRSPSRIISILILTPGLAWFGDILFLIGTRSIGVEEIAGIPLESIAMLGVVIAGLAMIAAGYQLHSYSASADSTEPASDTAV